MADKTTFTPGPWAVGTREIVGDWGGINYFRVVLPDGDVWECQASAMCGDEYQRRRANAHLMKAAPEMYEALKWFVEATTHWDDTGGRIAIAKNALAKAVPNA